MVSFTTRWKLSLAIFSISSWLMPILSKQAKRFGNYAGTLVGIILGAA